MSRKPRIEFPGAFYHVLARGNNKQKIFNDRQDYCVYLVRLKRYQERYKFILFVYVAVRLAGINNKSVAEFFQRDMSTISFMIQKIDKEIKNDKILKEQMEEVIKVIKA